jgi:hypothetical protein
MLEQSNHSRNPSYLVPCVIRTVRMIEALRESGTGLRVENLQSMTGYPRTTIYRILRTLVACEYIRRDSGGSYRLNYTVLPAVGKSAGNDASDSPRGFPPKSTGHHRSGFERWGVRFLDNGARMDLPCGTTGASASPDGEH